jgi:DNA-binding transcriptional regulator GbsR (MarR family)
MGENIEYEKKIPFDKFLSSKGIEVEKTTNKVIIQNITKKDIYNQLELIHTFHNTAKNYNSLNSKFIKNKLGKAIEKYKISIKNLKKDINSYNSSNAINEFENYLVQSSLNYTLRAEKAIELIIDSNYIGLIKRSMRRFEICLGNTFLSNLWEDNGIKIGTLKHCSYNMIEMDGVYFLNKLKRNGLKMDYIEAINKFCEIQGLGEDSVQFMKALLSYPHEFMKCAERYREGRKGWTINEYKNNLFIAEQKDGESIF